VIRAQFPEEVAVLAMLLFPILAIVSLFTTDGGGSGAGGTGGTGGSTTDSPGDGSGSGANPGGTGETSGTTPPAFTPITSQADLDRLLGTRLAQKERSVREAVTAEVEARIAADAKAAAAKEQGDFKSLFEAEQARVADLAKKVADTEALIAERDRDAMRTRIAAKHGLSAVLAGRLTGETEAEIEADATELAKHVKVTGAPATEAGAGGGTSRAGTRPVPPAKPATIEPILSADGRQKVSWPTKTA